MNSADESKVEVFEYGKGQPLLFLPAIGLTAPIWIKQFLTLSHKYKMIVIHVPGYGLSDVVKNLGTKKSGEIIVDIIKRLNLKEKVNITASCLGTIVASYLARFYPDIFKTVCLVGGFYDNSDLPNLDSSNLSVEELDTMMKEVSSSIGRDFDSLLNKDLYEEKEILLNSRCANSLAAIRYMNEMLTLNTAEWLKDIKIPALCIYGDRDTVIKPERSKAIHEFIQGSSLNEICEYVTGKNKKVVVSNLNSKSQTVISGSKEGINEAIKLIEKEDFTAIELNVSGAFHSPLMEEAAYGFNKYLKSFVFRELMIPVISSVDGKVYQNESIIEEKLTSQLTQPVLWTKVIEEIMQKKPSLIIESGPKDVLTKMLKRDGIMVECFSFEKNTDFIIN